MKHRPYYAIKGYQILRQISNAELSKTLGITPRTLYNKIVGRSDFTTAEGNILSELFGVSQQLIFLQKDVPLTEH